jgi:hypothetical protein
MPSYARSTTFANISIRQAQELLVNNGQEPGPKDLSQTIVGAVDPRRMTRAEGHK